MAKHTLIILRLIEEIFNRFIDDCFVLWSKNGNTANTDVFRKFLNELHSSLKFTVEKGKSSYEQNFDTFAQVLNFLYVSIILHPMYYKKTHMTILIILVAIPNTQSKTYHTVWSNVLSYLYLTRQKLMKGCLN